MTGPEPPSGPQDPHVARLIYALNTPGLSEREVSDLIFGDDPWWTPERIAACNRHWEREWEQRMRRIRHWYPLKHYQEHGIPYGEQEERLRDLAARYARDLSVGELADELFAVMEACEQSHRRSDGGPWTNQHAYAIAARAHRFIERKDAQVDPAWLAALARWCEWANAQPAPRKPRQPRQPGQRERRQPGRRAS